MILYPEAKECLRKILSYVGEDPSREGLLETPDRVLRSYEEMLSGYAEDVSKLLKTFADGACDEMVVLRGISFTSLCEHHLLPFLGEAHIGYIPDGRIVGISKLARLLDAYAKRLQVQERLTVQITRALDEYLHPLGSACVIEATHLCMSCRGVMKHGVKMITSSLTGAFRDEVSARSEFLRLIGK